MAMAVLFHGVLGAACSGGGAVRVGAGGHVDQPATGTPGGTAGGAQAGTGAGADSGGTTSSGALTGAPAGTAAGTPSACPPGGSLTSLHDGKQIEFDAATGYGPNGEPLDGVGWVCGASCDTANAVVWLADDNCNTGDLDGFPFEAPGIYVRPLICVQIAIGLAPGTQGSCTVVTGDGDLVAVWRAL